MISKNNSWMILKLQLLKGILKSYMFALFNGDGIDKYASNPPISPQHTALCFRTTSRTPTRRQGVNLQSAADDCDRRGKKKQNQQLQEARVDSHCGWRMKKLGSHCFFFGVSDCLFCWSIGPFQNRLHNMCWYSIHVSFFCLRNSCRVVAWWLDSCIFPKEQKLAGWKSLNFPRNEPRKKPWLVGLYRGLYYPPVFWGFLKAIYKL